MGLIIRDQLGAVSTHGMEWSGLGVAQLMEFRVAFANYGHLLGKGEKLTGKDWALRILDNNRSSVQIKKTCELIILVLGA